MFEFALAQLSHFSTGDQRQYHVRREAVLNCCFHTKSVCCVDEDTCVLRSNDGIDDGSEIVDIGEGLDAKHHVVESNRTTLCGILGVSNNYAMVSLCPHGTSSVFAYLDGA